MLEDQSRGEGVGTLRRGAPEPEEDDGVFQAVWDTAARLCVMVMQLLASFHRMLRNDLPVGVLPSPITARPRRAGGGTPWQHLATISTDEV